MLPVLSSADPLSQASNARPMAFKNLTVRDGLSQNNVMDIYQDSQGYIWLATENGLDRYDGYTFHRYQRGLASQGQLASDYVWDIVEDQDQNLWLATAGGGLVRWHRKQDRFEHFRHDPYQKNSLSSDRVRTLLATDEGIWIGTDGAGLNFYDPKTDQFTNYAHDPKLPNSLPSNEVFALLEDNQGRLWVGTNDGLAWLQPGSERFTILRHNEQNPLSLSNNRIRALYQDRHGGIWAGTFGGGLNLLDRRTEQFKHFRASLEPGSLSDDHVRSILEDDAGRLWVGTAQGLNVMHPYTDSFASYFRDDATAALHDDFIMSLFQDSGGVLWIGTRTAGVSTWNSHSWYFGHNDPEWLQQQSITAFASYDHYVWVAAFNAGFSQTNLVTNEVTIFDEDHPEMPLPDNRVMSLLADRQGGLWIGTMEDGLLYRAPNSSVLRQFKHEPDNPSSIRGNEIMSLYEANDGHIWVGTFSNGVSRLNPKTFEFTSFAPAPHSQICGSQGRAFAEDAQQRLWIGTENGLCRLNPANGQITTYRHDETDASSISSNSIYALHLDSNKRLWVGTGDAGLNQVLQGGAHADVSFRVFDRSNRLASNTIFGVVSDGEGHLWLSSNNGLMRFDPVTFHTRVYQSTHGLQGNEFHYGATHKDQSGKLYFGGANGFNVFDPSQIHSANTRPAVVLTQLLKLNQPVNAEVPISQLQELTLNYLENAVTFEFAALDFTEPENNRYRYKLDGFDESWVDAGTRRTATYTNLDPGSYRFRAMGAGSDGVWNDDGIDIGLHVNPPPWLSWWAYLLYAIAVAASVLSIWRAQQRKLERAINYRQHLENEVIKRTEELAASNQALQKASEAKSEFVAHMSHEIRSPINGILGMSELLNRTDLQSSQRKFADTIQSSTQSLLDIVNDILDFSKLETRHMELDPINADLEALMDEVASMFVLQAQGKGIELIVQLPVNEMPALYFDPLRLRQILVNLLGNAVKFTDTGHVILSAAIDKQKDGHVQIEFEVSDTGVGIARGDQAKVFESFTQAEASTSRRFGGTGLGLSISRELVTLMGGDLNLTSTPGKGTTFRFQLILPLQMESLPKQAAVKLSGPVLIVSREKILLEQLSTYLIGWGCEVIQARSADAVMEELTRVAPALIVIDQRLPDTRGTLLAEKLLRSGVASGRLLTLLPISSSEYEFDLPSLQLPIARKSFRTAVEAGLVGKLDQQNQTSEEAHVHQLAFDAEILLVEDNIVNQEVFVGMLAELGCRATVAIDGFSAISLVRENNFDLILMDYRLPDIDGTEVTQRIRELQLESTATPIIALTANASAEDRKTCLAAGMDDFLAKPCPMSDLSGALQRWLPDSYTSTTGLMVRPTSDSAPSTGAYDVEAIARISMLKRPDGTSMLSHATQLFSQLSIECCDNLKQALEDENEKQLQFTAHKLKSACANLGLSALSSLCREMEEHAQNAETQQARTLVDRLLQDLPPASAWLQQQVERHVE